MITHERIRAILLFAAFVACCLDTAAVAAILLIARWAAQDPERDPAYLFFKRFSDNNDGRNS